MKEREDKIQEILTIQIKTFSKTQRNEMIILELVHYDGEMKSLILRKEHKLHMRESKLLRT
jgi:hypothetical protein